MLVRHTKGNEDEVSRQCDATCIGFAVVVGEVDGAAHDATRVSHGGPNTLASPLVPS